MSRLRAELRRPSRTWWATAVVLYALLGILIVGHLQHANNTVGWVWLSKIGVYFAAALWTWGWRTRRTGLLWVGTASGIALADLLTAWPDSRLASTLGVLGLFNAGSFETHFLLAYPTGRLESVWARLLVIGSYVGGAVQTIPPLLFFNEQAPTYFYVGHGVPWLDSWNWWWTLFWVATTPLMFALFTQRYLGASRAGRRTLGPFYIVVTVALCNWMVFATLTTLAGHANFYVVGTYSFAAYGYAIAFTAVLGLLVTRRARGVVGDLVVDLGRAGPGGVRSALAKAIGDPTLELALWLPERRGWVDERGRDVELPEGGDRAVTLVGERLAAMVHDPVLLDQPALLEAAGSAARFALENERLQAELRAQLAELRESRARIVRAGDAERRRLERDLHDGAQQRLVGLGMALQLLRSHVDPSGGVLLEETREELQRGLAELRELARGIHPAVLTEQGLEEAIRTLAGRAPLPVEVRACGERLPAHVETAAYFVVAEALTNVARYAHAATAQVEVEHNDGRVRIQVSDDGVGGADPSTGSGLRGLADRVGALDGHLEIESPAGAGTQIIAEIPCAS